MEALRIAETIGFSEENSTFKLAHQEDACFLHSRTGQLHTLPSCLRKKGFDDAGIKFSYRKTLGIGSMLHTLGSFTV